MTKNKTPAAEPELSRPLRVEKISANGVEETITATPEERKALAERFDLIEITSLTAKLHIVPKQAGLNFAVDGSLAAAVVQRCVVTLEPLPTDVKAAIHVHFAAPAFIDTAIPEQDMKDDDLEPITDGVMDLGELVAQHLGLALDPYPRKPGLPPVEAEFGEPITKISPFAKLVVLKNKREE